MPDMTVLLIALSLIAADVRIAPGVILVASRSLADPNFKQTVVVIAEANEEGTLGLVLNRRTDMPLSQVLEKWKEAAAVKDPIFMGGPVGRTGMFALIRTKTPPEGAKRVLGDIHMVMDRGGLTPHLNEGPAKVRVSRGLYGMERGAVGGGDRGRRLARDARFIQDYLR